MSVLLYWSVRCDDQRARTHSGDGNNALVTSSDLEKNDFRLLTTRHIITVAILFITRFIETIHTVRVPVQLHTVLI